MSEHTPVAPLQPEAGRAYQFYAFISYKHLDKPWARWVQKQLEHYRLPSRLCREQNLPKHVSPIFRDETDLLGGKTVHILLEEKLLQSKFLIVICSRNIQNNPKYIDYEIETFLAAGNPSSRILPLIVDGEANSRDPAKECLPPALLRMGDSMPLGITLNKKDRKETVLKLIASILELDLQALRSHNHDRQQRRIVAALGCGLAFSLGLGAFMTWEMLSVKQAGLHEQLTYAADTFRQGDRVSAYNSAAAVADEYSPLMDPSIQAEAQQLSLMAAIHPKYQPMLKLCNASANSRLMFDTSGQHVMVISDTTVRKFDTAGAEVMTFDVSQQATKIVDVCADGVHAVVMTIYYGDLDGTRLWLWNMETNEPLIQLVYSAEYDEDNQRTGILGDVVAAKFSSDGKTVCAWRDGNGGYFNASEELAAWDVQSGEKLFTFSADLLGFGNRPREVKAFEFIGNDTLHWTGSSNHVYYTLGDAEPFVISSRSMPSNRDKTTVSIGHGRYTFAQKDGSISISDLVSGKTLTYSVDEWTAIPHDYNGRYLLLDFVDDTLRSNAFLLIDLHTMAELRYTDALRDLCRGWEITWAPPMDGSPYVYLNRGGDSVYRFDLTSGDVLYIDVPLAQEYELVAHMENQDILAANIEGRTCILEVEGQSLREYTIDEEYSQFVSSAAFSGLADYMAAKHDGSYYLYPVIHPGTRLDANDPPDPNAIYAASGDGQLILKGAGTTLSAWKNGEALMTVHLPAQVLRVDVAYDGRFIATTRKTLHLYSSDGTLLGQYEAPEDVAIHSARITSDGSRVVMLTGQDRYYAANIYDLTLLDGENLEHISLVFSYVHTSLDGVIEASYDVSPNSKWVSATTRFYPEGSMDYQIVVSVWSTADGTLLVQSQHTDDNSVPQFDLHSQPNGVSSAYRMQYVHFAQNNLLLSGLQYGTWIFDVEQAKTVNFISEGSSCDALPDMLDNDLLLYPTNGLHVWDGVNSRIVAELAHAAPLTGVNAMLKATNQNRLYITNDQQWAVIAGYEDTWLYRTDDWSTSTVLAPQRAQVLHLDEHQLVYATADGLWRLTYTVPEVSR